MRPTLFIVIGIAALCYTAAIIAVPDHFSDDYYLFGRAAQGNILMPMGEYDPYLLAARPMAAVWFSWEYELFGAWAAGKKAAGALLLCGSAVLIWMTAGSLSRIHRFPFSGVLASLSALLFAIHHSNVASLLWIANQNEAGMVFFYLVSVVCYLRSLEDTGRMQAVWLTASAVSFLVSILFKQQGIHLPALMLLHHLLRVRSGGAGRSTAVRVFLAVMFLLAGAVIILNMLMVDPLRTTFHTSGLWKKPFALVGLFQMVALPFQYAETYRFFLQHPMLSLTLLVVIIIGAGIVLARRRQWILPAAVLGFAVVIICFPRMFDVADNDRVNSIQAAWFSIGIAIVSMRYVRTYPILPSLLMGYVVLHGFGFTEKTIFYHDHALKPRSLFLELYERIRSTPDPVCILLSMDATNASAYMQYFETGRFGIHPTISAVPLFFFPTGVGGASTAAAVEMTRRSDTVTFRSRTPGVGFVFRLEFERNIIAVRRTADRWADEVTFTIPHYRTATRYYYYDGSQWQTL